ncbi:hypothetical protein CRE_19404 [Caenorhabditis remanei]|uniref:Uncharacterized protein n=1 Tax=Caenorhabditis remanei TaxID=31234 RepID=E3N575_CAERE|nr:hypothetical protein CRE_19404 [Caenorhabditis remanei]
MNTKGCTETFVSVSPTHYNLTVQSGPLVISLYIFSTISTIGVSSKSMYDYRRFSLSSLSSTVSPTETSVISVFPTPTEKDFLLFRLENSNKRLIEQWKQCKKEVGEKIVDLWSYKQCVAMWMLFTCFMATIEVYQCIEIHGMDEALRNSAFVVETLIFLFPIGYLYWQERQEKSKMRANNKNVENAEEIKEVVFDLEKAENEEYLEFYKDQLEWFNSVKLKEISSLEEEIRRMDNRGFRWVSLFRAFFKTII